MITMDSKDSTISDHSCEQDTNMGIPDTCHQMRSKMNSGRDAEALILYHNWEEIINIKSENFKEWKR